MTASARIVSFICVAVEDVSPLTYWLPIAVGVLVAPFAIAPLKTGQYTFFANVAKFSISGVKVHASLSKVINVSPALLAILENIDAPSGCLFTFMM